MHLRRADSDGARSELLPLLLELLLGLLLVFLDETLNVDYAFLDLAGSGGILICLHHEVCEVVRVGGEDHALLIEASIALWCPAFLSLHVGGYLLYHGGLSVDHCLVGGDLWFPMFLGGTLDDGISNGLLHEVDFTLSDEFHV